MDYTEYLEDCFIEATDDDRLITSLRAQRDRLLSFASEGSLEPTEIARLSDIVTEAIVRAAVICAGISSLMVASLHTPSDRRH